MLNTIPNPAVEYIHRIQGKKKWATCRWFNRKLFSRLGSTNSNTILTNRSFSGRRVRKHSNQLKTVDHASTYSRIKKKWRCAHSAATEPVITVRKRNITIHKVKLKTNCMNLEEPSANYATESSLYVKWWIRLEKKLTRTRQRFSQSKLARQKWKHNLPRIR